MKTLFKYILAAAMTLSFAACQEKEPYAPGDPDPLDCHGVFFSQTQAKDYELAPEDKRTLTFTVERTLDIEEAYVPYELISSEEGFFELEDEFLYFDEDQKSAKFKVNFSDDFEVGKKYTCTIKVTDPQYVSNYGLSSNELTFSVTVVEWELLGEGLWRDDFFSSYCTIIGAEILAPYQEKPVKIYQRSDIKGYYRIDEIYTADFVSYMVDGNDSSADLYVDYCPAYSIYVNAMNPEKVYIPLSYAFKDPSPYNYGDVYIVSDVQEEFTSGYSNLYGTLKDGVITFPKNSIMAYLPSAGMGYANQAGKLRLVLPGYQPYDYSIAVKTSPSEAGVMPVEFTLGPDVAVVKYQVFKGHLSDVEMVSKLEEVKTGKNVLTVTESGVYNYTSEETGLYTMIACSFDATGNYKEYDFVRFGYDTAADPKDVDIHMGLIVSDKYAGSGLTSENSMEFYVYGTELTEVKAAIYKKAHYENFREAIDVEFKYYISPLTRDELAMANSSGYSGVIGNLTAGTEYILVVQAANNYHSGVFTTTQFTAGEYDLMDAEFVMYDLPTQYQPESKTEYFKDWEVWSVDPYSNNWNRVKRTVATFSDDEDLMFDINGKVTEDPKKAVTTYDYLKVNGLYPNAAKKYGFEDEVQFEFYEGFVYTIMTQMSVGEWEGKPIYPTNAYLFIANGSLSAYLENGAMIGGFVSEEKDVIAFVGNPNTEAGSYGFSYVAMMLCYFTSEDYSGDAPLIQEDTHAYPLFISPDSQYVASDASALKAPAACNRVSAELMKSRTNYVENDHGYIKSTIDRVKNIPHNYLNNSMDVNVFIDREPASFTMTKAL